MADGAPWGGTAAFLRYFGVVTLLPILLFLNLPRLLHFDIYTKACPLKQCVLCLRPSLSLALWRSHASLVGWEGPDCRFAQIYSAQSNRFHQNSISRISDDYRIRFRMRVKWVNVILKRCWLRFDITVERTILVLRKLRINLLILFNFFCTF